MTLLHRLRLRVTADEPAGISTNTIQSDMVERIGPLCRTATSRSRQRMLWCFHCPPVDTKLDLTYGQHHVGSSAIRSAIEQWQPLATFHGLAPETVKVGGDFRDRLADTWCFAAGNRWAKKKLRCVVVDTENPKRACYVQA